MSTRSPTAEDAAAVFQLVRAAGTLEENTAYAYVLLCSHFSDTCVLAERDGKLIGCALGYRIPSRPRTLFVWQIGVSPLCRRGGVGRRLLDEFLSRPSLADLEFLDATVAPSNAASRGLFERWASGHDLEMRRLGTLDSSLFGPQGEHEFEEIFHIGPLQKEP